MNAVIGALRVVLGLDSAAFDKGLGQAQARASRFGASLRTGLMAASAAAAGAAGAIGLAVKGAIDEADKMDEIAQKIGVPTEELSRMKYAAEINGVAFESLQKSVGKLSKNMADAMKGTGASADAFKQFGISVMNSDGTLRSSSDVMKQIADRFQTMPDGAQKTAMAMELMGKSGAEMILMLNGGAAALDKTMADADKFGQVFTAEMGANAGKFNENLDKIVGTFGSLAAQIAQGLLPALTHLSEFMLELVQGFSSLSPGMKEFISIAGALTIATAGLAIPLGAVAIAIGAIGWPITAVVAGIGLLTAAVIKFWPEIKAGWEWLGKFTDVMIRLHVEALSAVVTGFQQLGPAIVTALSGLGEQILSVFRALPGQMMEIGGQIIDGLWQGIQNKWASVKASVVSLGDSVAQSFRDALGIQSPSRVMAEVGTNIMQGLNNGMVAMKPAVAGVATGVASDVKVAFKGAESAGQSLAGAFSSAFKGILDSSKSVKDALSDLLGSFADMAMDTAFQAIFGGGMAGSSGGIFGSLFGGLGSLLGFANGGSFRVGGAGGVDSQLVAFKASPNETVSITKPGQVAGGGGGSMHVTFAADVSESGNLIPFVTSVSDQRIQRAAPGIVGAASRQVVPVMAAYQSNKAGGDYRG